MHFFQRPQADKARASQGAVLDPDLSIVRLHNRLNNGQPQASPARAAVAIFINAAKRLKHRLSHVLHNTQTVIINADSQPPLTQLKTQLDLLLGTTQGVA